jgi:anthranilate synthase/aminodeoxychorismate synthase-like glutamine amidotransferase
VSGKRILVIDNYDSFTFNLVQYLGELGAETVVRRNDELTVEGIAAFEARGLIISPGPCTPKEAGISVELVRAWSGRLPILGVCLGHQSIGAAFGAEVVRAPSIMHGKTSEIVHDGAGIFRGLPNPFTATRYHSLCVLESSLPPELVVTARVKEAPGEAIMGIRHRAHPTEGLQFHPESILTQVGHDLLRNFLASCT